MDQTQQESLSSQSTIPIYLPESHQAIKKISEKIAEVRTQQQQEEEHRRKLIILHQQQQIQQCEATARIKEEKIICEKKQQDQCNFPAVPITDNIPFNNYYYRNLNNTANPQNSYNNAMDSISNQHSSQVQVVTQHKSRGRFYKKNV